MTIPTLKSLAEVADDYDLFIFDLWGVLHDGEAAFPGAVDCLRRLRERGVRVVLLSNAARLSTQIAAHLMKLGITEDLYNRLLTSGEATAEAIAAGASGSGAAACPSYFYLGPERCRPMLAACGGRETDLEGAEIIICSGLVEDETEQPGDYGDLLREGAARGLTMVCANPDVTVIRGGRKIACAGALAALYEELGGEVERYGKPYPAIFEQAFADSPEIPRSRAVMIGDSLTTDIRGARQAGIDALWIAGGLHAEALEMAPDGQLRADRVDTVAAGAGEQPKAVLPWLVW